MRTVMVVINVAGRRIGIIVDGVSDVKKITVDQIRMVDGSPRPDTHLYTASTGEEQLALMDMEGLMESLHHIIEAAK